MDLWGNQFSCCVLNGGIEMKCRIIKKITSPPSHVIMSGSRGTGALPQCREEAPFDLNERTPRPGPAQRRTMGGFHRSHTLRPHCKSCSVTVGLSTRQMISRYCCQRKGGVGGGLVAWTSKSEWLRVGTKSVEGGCLEYISQWPQWSECFGMLK